MSRPPTDPLSQGDRVCLGLYEDTKGSEEDHGQKIWWLVLQEVWNNLPTGFLQKLCGRGSRCCLEGTWCSRQILM